MAQPFILSIETEPGISFQHGFHLGTIEPIARQIAEDMFHGRDRYGLPIVTVALKRNGKLFDVYYGDEWHSNL